MTQPGSQFRKTTVTVEIAPGELVDKITILQIKRERIADAGKLANVQAELDVLQAAMRASVAPSAKLDELAAALKQVNQQLWEVEDQLRLCERLGEFGERFVAHARSVYHRNDLRCRLKRQINELLGSTLLEEKQHPSYDSP